MSLSNSSFHPGGDTTLVVSVWSVWELGLSESVCLLLFRGLRLCPFLYASSQKLELHHRQTPNWGVIGWQERLLRVSSYAPVALLASSMMCDLWNNLALAAARPGSGPPTQPSHLMAAAPF